MISFWMTAEWYDVAKILKPTSSKTTLAILVITQRYIGTSLRGRTRPSSVLHVAFVSKNKNREAIKEMQNKTQIPVVHNSFERIFTDNDVLFGRGRAIEKHPGNRAFRLYVQQYADEYSQASRAVKSHMLSEVLQSVKKRGVRMFKFSEGGIWQQADDKEMKLKVSVFLHLVSINAKVPFNSSDIHRLAMR